MALVDKREDGTAIYNRTVTGETLYLHSMRGGKSVYTAQEKADHISRVIDYRLEQWAMKPPTESEG